MFLKCFFLVRLSVHWGEGFLYTERCVPVRLSGLCCLGCEMRLARSPLPVQLHFYCFFLLPGQSYESRTVSVFPQVYFLRVALTRC